VSPDEGAHADDEKDLVAGDVGIDGAAASARKPRCTSSRTDAAAQGRRVGQRRSQVRRD